MAKEKIMELEEKVKHLEFKLDQYDKIIDLMDETNETIKDSKVTNSRFEDLIYDIAPLKQKITIIL